MVCYAIEAEMTSLTNVESDENNRTVTIPQADLNNLRLQVQLLQNSNAAREAQGQLSSAAA